MFVLFVLAPHFISYVALAPFSLIPALLNFTSVRTCVPTPHASHVLDLVDATTYLVILVFQLVFSVGQGHVSRRRSGTAGMAPSEPSATVNGAWFQKRSGWIAASPTYPCVGL